VRINSGNVRHAADRFGDGLRQFDGWRLWLLAISMSIKAIARGSPSGTAMSKAGEIIAAPQPFADDCLDALDLPDLPYKSRNAVDCHHFEACKAANPACTTA